MQTITETMNHAAAQKLAWCVTVMAAGVLVSATTCTKIRPVWATGGPFGRDAF